MRNLIKTETIRTECDQGIEKDLSCCIMEEESRLHNTQVNSEEQHERKSIL